MKKIRILGAGRFGIRAAEILSDHADILLIDKDMAVCQQAEEKGFRTVCADGVGYLTMLESSELPDMIIPSVPIHLAYQWIKQQIAPRQIPVPTEIISRLPNPMTGKTGEVYISYADFICPDNCPEPAEICTFTRQARKGTLYKLLESFSGEDFTSVVVRSRQLAPGIGGYTPQALSDALEQVRHAEKTILFSTACRCHGVMHAFL